MDENERIEEVQVSELRARLRHRLAVKKPLILRKNSSVVGILLCVDGGWYGSFEPPRKEARRLRGELESVLKQIIGR